MKYLKGIIATTTALAASMLLSSAASATITTSTEGLTPTITAESVGSVTFTSTFFPTIHCANSEFAGSVTSHGSGVSASGPITTLHFRECTDPVTVENNGRFSISSASTTGNGTFFLSDTRLNLHTGVGECIIQPEKTDLGVLVGGHGASLPVKGASIPVAGGSFFCPTSVIFEGTYKITSPTELSVH